MCERMCHLNLFDEVMSRGFSDCRVISTQPFLVWGRHMERLRADGHAVSSTMTAYPEDVMEGTTAIIVLMTAFLPYDENAWPE